MTDAASSHGGLEVSLQPPLQLATPARRDPRRLGKPGFTYCQLCEALALALALKSVNFNSR